MNMAIPSDRRNQAKKKKKKITKYQYLRVKKKATVVPVGVRTLGAIP